MVHIGNSWDDLLADEFEKDYYKALRQFLITEYKAGQVYPPAADIFNALKATPYEKVRVVILGQDPYHGPGQAHGLCFSVRKGVKAPPSLVNIFRELNADLGCPIPSHGYLMHWAEQGVLLLNTCLTVREGKPNSHRGKGWETFTDRVIRLLNDREEPIVFLLWGANAQSKIPLITNPHHLILKAPHPSPLSAHAGFFGCRHFSRANSFLAAHGEGTVDWAIPE